MNTNEIRDKILSRYTAERELQQDGGQVPIVEAPQSSGANPWGLLSASTNNIGSILQKEDQRNQAMFNIQGARQDQKNADIAARDELLLKHQNAVELAKINKAPAALNAQEQYVFDKQLEAEERTKQHSLISQGLAESDVDLNDQGQVNNWLRQNNVDLRYGPEILGQANSLLQTAVGGEVAPSVENYGLEIDKTLASITNTAKANTDLWLRENNMSEANLRGETLNFTADGTSKAINDILAEKGINQEYSDVKPIVEYMQKQMNGKIDVKLLGRILDNTEDTGLFSGKVDDINTNDGIAVVDKFIAEAGYGTSDRAKAIRKQQKDYEVYNKTVQASLEEATRKAERFKSKATKKNLLLGGRRELTGKGKDTPILSADEIAKDLAELNQYVPTRGNPFANQTDPNEEKQRLLQKLQEGNSYGAAQTRMKAAHPYFPPIL